MIEQFNNSWDDVLATQWNSPYYKALWQSIEEDEKKYSIYPPRDKIFTLFHQLPLEKIKVVILGQDPYHKFGQAMGLSFSVPKQERILPPSLRNILLELQEDLGIPLPPHGDLTSWVTQGVFLLNTTLTVRESQPNSHQKLGWIDFTTFVLQKINDCREGIVFVLWGKEAEKMKIHLDETRHYILSCSHPSPFSAHLSFFGSKPFSKINKYLHHSPIDWTIR